MRLIRWIFVFMIFTACSADNQTDNYNVSIGEIFKVKLPIDSTSEERWYLVNEDWFFLAKMLKEEQTSIDGNNVQVFSLIARKEGVDTLVFKSKYLNQPDQSVIKKFIVIVNR